MPRKIGNRRKEVRKQARKERKHLRHTYYAQKRSSKSNVLSKTKTPRKPVPNRNLVPSTKKVVNLPQDDTEDDQVIRKLEKRLKLKGKRSLPSNFYDEGLGYILGYKSDVGEEGGGIGEVPQGSDSGGEQGSMSDEDSSLESEQEEVIPCAAVHADRKLDNTENTELHNDTSLSNGENTEHISPPLSHVELDPALTKRITGLINRLSKSNLHQTVSQLSQLYQENTAHDMNTAVSHVLQRACIQDVLLPDRLCIECMLVLTITQGRLITANRLGIHFIVKIVKEFDTCYREQATRTEEGPSSKLCHNTARCLSYLYCFKVISSVLIYDLVRKLASRCCTLDIELLLIILSTVGLEIRKEDPHSMKEIIMEIQARKKSIVDSRVDWMLDTINAIKTNNHRKIPNYDSSKLEEYSKLLKSAKITELTQLSVRYEEILKVDEYGNSRLLTSMYNERKSNETANNVMKSNESKKFAKLMHRQRMNTDIRRKIFTVLMTSSDYLEAAQNLIKLDLTKVQRREIPKIVVECCLQEDPFNPYYAYLSQHVCKSARGEQVTYQYTLWDKIKNLREMSHVQTSNLVQLMLHLIHSKSISICVLKVINFTEIDKPTIAFLRQLLSLLLFDLPEARLVGIFQGLRGKEHLQSFRYSLSLFLKHLMLDHQPNRVRRVSIVQEAMGMSCLIKI